MSMNVQPVTLVGKTVRLEPLGRQHSEGLNLAGQDQAIWRYLPVNASHSRDAISDWIAAALAAQETGQQMPFAIIATDPDKGAERPIGSTRYLSIAPADYGLEIGWTWLAREAWRTAINTECKYLLLQHAFETLGAIRVQLKTDSRNQRSQRAIERLGAVREGILRKQMVLEDSYQRDTVVYSIIASEWPVVKARLARWLAIS